LADQGLEVQPAIWSSAELDWQEWWGSSRNRPRVGSPGEKLLSAASFIPVVGEAHRACFSPFDPHSTLRQGVEDAMLGAARNRRTD
jgi:hypothetical protein